MLVWGWQSAVYGGKLSNVAASVTDFNGHATDALPTSTYLDLEMHNLTLKIVSHYIPEAGAVCGSSARTDLCGGQVTATPTATDSLGSIALNAVRLATYQHYRAASGEVRRMGKQCYFLAHTYEFERKSAEFVLVLLKHKSTARMFNQSLGMSAA